MSASAELRVGLVAQALNVHHLRGIGRYEQELLRHTEAGDGVAWTAYAQNAEVPMRLPEGYGGDRQCFDQRGDRFHLWEQWALPRRARHDGLQVLHCAENSAPWWQPVPTVITLHDTMPWTEQLDDAGERRYRHWVLPAAIARCDAVITISASSRADILQRWPELEPRLVVVHHGIADAFFADAVVTHTPPTPSSAPYLVYLGGPMERKRLSWALRLLESVPDTSMRLVVCGYSPQHPPAIPESLRHRVEVASFLSDADLVQLLRGASATLYPTLYEGFGFPAVESQAAGTPVLFSPVSSLTELCGPLSWNPPVHDFDAWVLALRQAIALKPQEREQRRVQALAWAQRYSWRRSALAHQAVYRGVVQARAAGRRFHQRDGEFA